MESDPINPGYYKSGGIEAIEVIEAFFMDTPHLANAFKYLARLGKKPGNDYRQEAEKAKWYIDRFVDYLDKHAPKTLTVNTCSREAVTNYRHYAQLEDTDWG
ncbi:DUF3310 domain-containing protein [Corynebacterium pyruviciproducens]